MQAQKVIVARLQTFRSREDGVATVELIMAVVILNMFLMAFYTWWNAFNNHAIVDRAAYTVSDLVTRQRGTVLQRSLLDGMDRTAEFIIDPDLDASVRFTQVTLVAGNTETDPDTLRIDWTYSPCSALPAAQLGSGFDIASLPVMAEGASMLVTDVRVEFPSSLDLLPSLTFERRAVAIYRFENSFSLDGTGASTCPG